MTTSQARRNSSHMRRSNRPQSTLRMETLESRTLLSAIVSYTIDPAFPVGIAQDNAGNIWLGDGSGLYKISPTGTQIGGPWQGDKIPYDVVYNPANQHIYFSESLGAGGAIVETDLLGFLQHTYTVPNPDSEAPMRLTVATDGSVWFTTPGASNTDGTVFTSEIGRLDLSGNLTFASVSDMDPNSQPNVIVAAPDGSVWFDAISPGPGPDGVTLLGSGAIGHAHSNLDGSITIDPMYAVSDPGSFLTGMTVANDGSIWFAQSSRGGQFQGPADGPDRITHGVLSGGVLHQTDYILPGATDTSMAIVSVAGVDSTGRVWFIEQNPSCISYLDPTTGDFTELATPATFGPPVNAIVTSTDVWATAFGSTDTLARVDLTSFASPITAGTPNITATVGQPVTGTLVTFHTSDNGPYTYSIDYGDGETGAGSVNSDGSGNYTIAASATYAAAGNYTTAVIITTADGNSVTVKGMATVSLPQSNNPVVVQGINLVGQQDIALASNMTVAGAHILAVATFTAPVGIYTALINWGDGTTSAGAIYSLGSGAYAVGAPSKTYHSNALFACSVIVNGGPAGPAAATFTANIADTPLLVSSNLAVKTMSSKDPTQVVATFTDDIESTTAWFTATISWGDGTTSVGTIVANLTKPGSYSVVGTHYYTMKGVYNVLTLITNTVEDVSATATAVVKSDGK